MAAGPSPFLWALWVSYLREDWIDAWKGKAGTLDTMDGLQPKTEITSSSFAFAAVSFVPSSAQSSVANQYEDGVVE